MDLPRTLKIVVSEVITIGTIIVAVEALLSVYRFGVEKILRVLRSEISVNLFSRPPTVSFTILDMRKLPA